MTNSGQVMPKRSLRSLAGFIGVVAMFVAGAQAAYAERLVLQVKGRGEAVAPREIPGFERFPEAIQERLLGAIACFGAPLLDPATGLRLGEGFDCVFDIDDTTNAPAITLTDLVTFRFRGARMWTSSEVTVQPLLVAVSDKTHSTSSLPESQNILGGTGLLRRVTGTARLAGAVNLADFPNSVDFDCLFVIEID